MQLTQEEEAIMAEFSSCILSYVKQSGVVHPQQECSTSDQDCDPVVKDSVSVVPISKADNPVSERESTDAITVKERRRLLNAQLKGHKQEKLKKNFLLICKCGLLQKKTSR